MWNPTASTPAETPRRAGPLDRLRRHPKAAATVASRTSAAAPSNPGKAGSRSEHVLDGSSDGLGMAEVHGDVAGGDEPVFAAWDRPGHVVVEPSLALDLLPQKRLGLTHRDGSFEVVGLHRAQDDQRDVRQRSGVPNLVVEPLDVRRLLEADPEPRRADVRVDERFSDLSWPVRHLAGEQGA